MRTYKVRVTIENLDHGPAEHSEVLLGNVQAENIGIVVASAGRINLAIKLAEDADHPRPETE